MSSPGAIPFNILLRVITHASTALQVTIIAMKYTMICSINVTEKWSNVMKKELVNTPEFELFPIGGTVTDQREDNRP